jgi:hypothetical protein
VSPHIVERAGKLQSKVEEPAAEDEQVAAEEEEEEVVDEPVDDGLVSC